MPKARLTQWPSWSTFCQLLCLFFLLFLCFFVIPDHWRPRSSGTRSWGWTRPAAPAGQSSPPGPRLTPARVLVGVKEINFLRFSINLKNIKGVATAREKRKTEGQCCGSESGSGSNSHKYGSGSFYHYAKIVRKPLISTVLWFIFDFLSLKKDLSVPSKSTIVPLTSACSTCQREKV